MTSNIIRRKNGRSEMPDTPSFTGLVDQLFQNNLNRFFNDEYWPGTNTARLSVPVNVHETDKSFEMEIVAPGLRKEDFQLNVHGDLLTVSFEHKEENNKQQNNWIRQEYKMQSFTRSFNLDDSIDAAKISAKYNDGVLYLSLPKKENAQRLSKNIEIQ